MLRCLTLIGVVGVLIAWVFNADGVVDVLFAWLFNADGVVGGVEVYWGGKESSRARGIKYQFSRPFPLAVLSPLLIAYLLFRLSLTQEGVCVHTSCCANPP